MDRNSFGGTGFVADDGTVDEAPVAALQAEVPDEDGVVPSGGGGGSNCDADNEAPELFGYAFPGDAIHLHYRTLRRTLLAFHALDRTLHDPAESPIVSLPIPGVMPGTVEACEIDLRRALPSGRGVSEEDRHKAMQAMIGPWIEYLRADFGRALQQLHIATGEALQQFSESPPIDEPARRARAAAAAQ